MSSTSLADDVRLLERMYAAFNARDVETVLASMHPDVDWPNGMEGGRVLGHDAVRAYWTRQWTLIDPSVEPVRMSRAGEDQVDVEVHQVVRDRQGTVLKDETVHHVYTIERGLIRSMQIRPRAAA